MNEPQKIQIQPDNKPKVNPERTPDEMGFWVGGMNSLIPPFELGGRQYAYGENILSRGGIPQTRPGFRFITDLPGAKLQGMVMFTPTNASQQMIVAIDGTLFWANYPFTTFQQITGVSLSPQMETVVFKVCRKSVDEDALGVLKIIDPKDVLIVQDGISKAVMWDGGAAKNPKIPVGLWMEWANSRLWIANGSRLYAGNLADPEHFTENTYLAERSDFDLGEQITGMIQTTDLQGLLVFTATKTYSFQSGIRSRVLWQQTPGFQQLFLPSVGCVAGKSPINHYGLTHWFSQYGFVSLNSATTSKISSVMTTIDGPMQRSKIKISSDPSAICCASYENFLLVSVPSADRHNTHTWVRDHAFMGESYSPQDAAWPGIWTGIRPVEWATASVNGSQRCFVASFDSTAKNGNHIHVWEAFDRARTDNQDGRILCQFETGLIAQHARRKFCYAEIDLCEILGRVDLKVYAGGIRGQWMLVHESTLLAQEGSIGAPGQTEITPESVLQEFKPQARRIRTKDFSSQVHTKLLETGDTAGVDKAFGLLFVWRGRMGVQRAKIMTSNFNESVTGAPNFTETTALAINMQGSEVTQ